MMSTNYYFQRNSEPRLHIGKYPDGDRLFHSTMSERVVNILYKTGKYKIVDEYGKIYSLEEFWTEIKNKLPFVDGSNRPYTQDDDYW